LRLAQVFGAVMFELAGHKTTRPGFGPRSVDYIRGRVVRRAQ
jgi:hypothetical protein